MTSVCLLGNVDRHRDYQPVNVKMVSYSGGSQPAKGPQASPTIPIATVLTVNENWRGKNDPTERRRIQNRLNQRAFRQRQRAGESPKQYRPRNSASPQQEESDDEEESSWSSSEEEPPLIDSPELRSVFPAATASAASSQNGQMRDELARLINRNLIRAAVNNANRLGLDLRALQSATPITTPRDSKRSIPASLVPIQLQHDFPHDSIIDTIPHPRLRYNILRAIMTRQIDPLEFSRSVRSSGALEVVGGASQRGGLVVWDAPEQAASWELSEPFVRRWVALLEGCEDLIAATNAWRIKRGERLFPASLAQRNNA